MRQALAKGLRRELRRAVGTDGLEHIARLEQAVSILSHGVAGSQREIATLTVHQADTRTALHQGVEAVARDVAQFQTRGFIARFRWLLLGV